MVNIPELRKSVEWVEEQAALPWQLREWDQTKWCSDIRRPTIGDKDWWLIPSLNGSLEAECGTTYCVAGDIARRHGWKLTPGAARATKGNRLETVSDVAAEILGINTETASRLFDALNSAADVRRIAEEIAGEKL